ncbi:MAG: hypothetical protein AAGM22_06215 [Acidobacteriota bacterium]
MKAPATSADPKVDDPSAATRAQPLLKADAASLATATALLGVGLWLILMSWNAALWSDDRRLDRVEETLGRAHELGVALARPALFDRALSNLDAARSEARRQRANPWPRRHFATAEAHLEHARRDASALAAAAPTFRFDVESHAHRHLNRAQRAVDQVVDLYGRVPLGPETRLDVAFMQRDVHRLTGDLNLAELAYTAGEPILAGSWARHVEREAAEVAKLIDLSQAHRFTP